MMAPSLTTTAANGPPRPRRTFSMASAMAFSMNRFCMLRPLAGPDCTGTSCPLNLYFSFELQLAEPETKKEGGSPAMLQCHSHDCREATRAGRTGRRRHQRCYFGAD